MTRVSDERKVFAFRGSGMTTPIDKNTEAQNTSTNKGKSIEKQYSMGRFEKDELRKMVKRKIRLNRGPFLDLMLTASYYPLLLELAAILEDNVMERKLKYRLRTFKNAFIGEKAVSFMVGRRLAESRGDAVKLGNMLLMEGLIKHVTEDHVFKDEYLFYKVVKSSQATSSSPVYTESHTQVTRAGYSFSLDDIKAGNPPNQAIGNPLRNDVAILSRDPVLNTGGGAITGIPSVLKTGSSRTLLKPSLRTGLTTSKSFDSKDKEPVNPLETAVNAQVAELGKTMKLQRASLKHLSNRNQRMRIRLREIQRANDSQSRISTAMLIVFLLHLGIVTGRWLLVLCVTFAIFISVYDIDAQMFLSVRNKGLEYLRQGPLGLILRRFETISTGKDEGRTVEKERVRGRARGQTKFEGPVADEMPTPRTPSYHRRLSPPPKLVTPELTVPSSPSLPERQRGANDDDVSAAGEGVGEGKHGEVVDRNATIPTGPKVADTPVWNIAVSCASMAKNLRFPRGIRALVLDYWLGEMKSFRVYDGWDIYAQPYAGKIQEFQFRAKQLIERMKEDEWAEAKAGSSDFDEDNSDLATDQAAESSSENVDMEASPKGTDLYEGEGKQSRPNSYKGDVYREFLLGSRVEMARFLVARDWNVDKAVVLLRKALQLRRHYRLSNILATPFRKFSAYKSVVPTYHQGFTDDARLLVIRRTGLIDYEALDAWNLDEVRAAEQRLNEIAARVLLPAISRMRGQYEWRSVAVVDMAKARITDLLRKRLREFFSANSEVSQTCYPENLGKCYVVHAPSLFSLIWRFVRTLISRRTQQKVIIDTSSNPFKVLERDFKETQCLPEHLGGLKANPPPRYLNSEIEQLVSAYLEGHRDISEILPSNKEYTFKVDGQRVSSQGKST
eukprot:CAMPEP_0184488724 /NCGR_PEP_ID=MMETSP0113_2-20130426/13106_1 /TAXON_ID=91329 /ORGANISM="Norrisiella sphaerica, Strain BC52" /LENGTH=897 /DNA_ID=CAMNT_0026871691 /DNA_START=146 /DNA_END=2837 /DNA_ORIENTATION=+